MDAPREDGRRAAPEECLLCSQEIEVGADTMIYTGLRVHSDCYWRDIGIPPSHKRDLDSSWGTRDSSQDRD
jgi:hypothetical protein